MLDETDVPGQTRREFCAHTCRALSLAAFGGAAASVLQACGGGSATSPAGAIPALPVVSATESGGALTVAIDAASPLASVGAAALAQSPSTVVLLVRTADSAFTALSAVCTHQACTITGFEGGTFVCPCHGSQFSTSGRVLSGPAAVSLRQYHASFADGVVTITP